MTPHVLPLNDEAEHMLSRQCWCLPDARLVVNGQDGQPCGVMIVHRALDCRTVAEALTGSAPPGRKWRTVMAGQGETIPPQHVASKPPLALELEVSRE